ncbi:MAG: hypothetical protein KAH95_00070, partial [Spirochaetales bacterium]|nr:hypothetical protein [Spirochaetales bacterium]
MSFGSIKQIKLRLSRQWEKGKFLKAIAHSESLFPLETAIKGPTSAEMVNSFDAVRTWIRDIQDGCEKSRLQHVWKEINHQQLGRNSIPGKIVFYDIAELAGFLGKKTELKAFENGLVVLGNTFPDLIAWAVQYPFELIKNAPDIERLISIVKWRLKNTYPGIYLRQLSLPGVDTKFIEIHRKVISQWLDILLSKDQICEQFTGIGKFEQRYGFLSRPATVRFRILDPDLKIGNFSDVTVRADEFAALSLSVRYVFIVENDITALAFPPVKDAMVIFGRGYNFDHLIQASWLNEKELWYWGDIDTHGFAILNQFRTSFPSVRSFLMDRDTLLSHQAHWGLEKTPTAVDLSNLNKEEAHLYDELRSNKIRDNLRLEQEFIDFSWASKVI